MINLQKLIENIKNEPKLSLGSLSVELLSVFIRGYVFAQLDFGILPTNTISIPSKFNEWVCQELKIENITLSWVKIIILFSSNSVEAFRLFEQLFAKFCQVHKELFKSAQRQKLPSEIPIPTLNSVIMRVKPCPAIYLEFWSLSRMYVFLNGYLKACEEFSSFSEEIRREMDDFASWLAKKFEKEIEIYPKCSWHNILLLFYPNEETALEQFFIYYDKYLFEQSLDQRS